MAEKPDFGLSCVALMLPQTARKGFRKAQIAAFPHLCEPPRVGVFHLIRPRIPTLSHLFAEKSPTPPFASPPKASVCSGLPPLAKGRVGVGLPRVGTRAGAYKSNDA